MNSDHANNTDRNDGKFLNNKPKAGEKLYDTQKIILMLRIFNLKLPIQKFRDNKIETKEKVIYYI